MKKAFQIYCSLLALILLPTWAAAQCSWSFSATPDSSRCAASGKISIALTGQDAGSVTNRLYRLQAAAGGYEIPHSSTPLFENLAPGMYYVTVRGICGGVEDSITQSVSVPGNYVPFTADAQLTRHAFPNCATGQVKLTFGDGRRGYKATFTGKPAGYAGPTVFNTHSSELLVDALFPGNYTVVLSDSCGSSFTRNVTVASLPPVTDDMVMIESRITGAACNRLRFSVPNVQYFALHHPYFFRGTSWQFAVAYEGGAKTAFKPMCDTSFFELEIPGGKTLKDMWNKDVYYYFKDPCGQETSYPVRLSKYYIDFTFSSNCSHSFNISTIYSTGRDCYPLVISVENLNTGVIKRDTTFSWNNWHLDSLPFGDYRARVLTADSGILLDRNFTRTAPAAMPYNAFFYPQDGGQHRFGEIYITGVAGDALRAGTKVELVYPSSHYRSITLPYDEHSIWLYSTETSAFIPGTYVVKISDACGAYFDTLTVRDWDVFNYEWEMTARDSCAGQVLRVDGSVKFRDQVLPAYYSISAGPSGWVPDYQRHPMGSEIILPLPGSYRIMVGSTSGYMSEYPEVTFGGNVRTLDWSERSLTIDPFRSIGWVCPAAADNTGSIIVQLVNPLNATYTYSLAAQGKGATGPYIDVNTTGRFNSGGGYHLMVNQNYDVKVTDPCGTSVIQTIKIIDFATAQLASINKPAYCQGDQAKLSVINLPGSAITYSWTGPHGFTSNLQNPVISKLVDNNEGQYIVVIDADICSAPIRDTVNLVMAAFETICFSAITDTSVNPYAAGILGNWRPHRTYAYYGERKESDPQAATNIRTDGTYKDFLSFWKKQSNGWKPQYDTTRWVWNSESTIFNKKGFELENRDALNRFNSAIYGFEDALPLAVVQNSMLREAAFEGFEDFYFKGNNCPTGDCGTARRFDFTRYISWLDTTQRHTGRYSIKIPGNDTLQTSHMVVAAAAPANMPIFEKTPADCGIPGNVLKKVKADSTMVIPSFSPVAGKKILFSAWVKEERDCNCATYDNNVVQLVVKHGENTTLHEIRPSGNIIEGWQRYEDAVSLPAGTTQLSVMIIATGATPVYVDDIRLHPFNANMKSYAYDPVTLRMMAELDENNFATFFEYDDDGVLTRVKKETERGIKTIKETRSALVKE
ncbi:hypothetical protein ACQKLP_20080 [Chitinophaga sp. NPDC101104]|uniref:hypothetical protein n=1 Tax=Chitinophaga sp. NPDC101104 TaxID=3390561 RepID=UPI003D00DCEC